MNPSEIQEKLKMLASNFDVGVVVYNCSKSGVRLGGDVSIYSDIPQNPIKDRSICNICLKSIEEYYAWKLFWGKNRDEQLMLDLCNQCNTPQKIWDFIKTKTWSTWIFGFIYPSSTLDYQFYFKTLRLSTYRRSWMNEDEFEFK